MRQKLIDWEKEHGYKSIFVAEKLEISPSAWSYIKKGKRNPTFNQIMKMKEVFGIDLDMLVNE